VIYLDTSAAAKALIDEDGSAAVRRAFADGTAFVSSRLLAVELHAVADRRAISADAAQELLDRVALVSLTDETLARAVDLHSGLRTVDALHLATAIEIGDAIESILTFDLEFAAAAERFGIDARPRA
jgi:predicted nucleic acid-binding protein